jgi:alpha-L-fucosidase 2
LQILSKAGMPCSIKTGKKVKVLVDGKAINVKILPNQIVQFNTVKGKTYTVKGI